MYQQLRLENQLCHRLYIASNAVIRSYRPHLESVGITYPQYLVMMSLWELREQEVNQIREHTRIDGGALSLILKKLQDKGLISMVQDAHDKRIKRVVLTAAGIDLEAKAAKIPESLSCMLPDAVHGDLEQLKRDIDKLIAALPEQGKPQRR